MMSPFGAGSEPDFAHEIKRELQGLSDLEKRLQNYADQLRIKVQSMHERLHSAHEANQKLFAELTETKQSATNAHNQLETYKRNAAQKIGEFQQHLKAAIESQKKLEEELRTSHAKNQQLDTDHRRQRDLVDQLQERLRITEARTHDAETRAQRAERELISIKEGSVAAQRVKDQLTEERSHLDARNTELQYKLKTVQDHYTKLMMEYRDVKSEWSKIKGQAESALRSEQARSQIEQQLKGQMDELTQLRNEKARLQKTSDELSQNLTNISEEFSVAKQREGMLQQMNHALKQRELDLKEKIQLMEMSESIEDKRNSPQTPSIPSRPEPMRSPPPLRRA